MLQAQEQELKCLQSFLHANFTTTTKKKQAKTNKLIVVTGKRIIGQVTELSWYNTSMTTKDKHCQYPKMSSVKKCISNTIPSNTELRLWNKMCYQCENDSGQNVMLLLPFLHTQKFSFNENLHPDPIFCIFTKLTSVSHIPPFLKTKFSFYVCTQTSLSIDTRTPFSVSPPALSANTKFPF